MESLLFDRLIAQPDDSVVTETTNGNIRAAVIQKRTININIGDRRILILVAVLTTLYLTLRPFDAD